MRGSTSLANEAVEAFRRGDEVAFHAAMAELTGYYNGHDQLRIQLLAEAGLGEALRQKLGQLRSELADSYSQLQKLRCRRRQLAKVYLGWLLRRDLGQLEVVCDQLSKRCGSLERQAKIYSVPTVAERLHDCGEAAAVERFGLTMQRRALEEAFAGNPAEASRLQSAVI